MYPGVWVGHWSGDTAYSYISFSYYYESSEIASMKAAYEKAVQEVLTWVPDGATELQKVKVVHDWLVRNCVYGSDSHAGQSAYSALVTKRPVCNGYSLAAISVLSRLGIESQFVVSDTASHAWIKVKVDGSWYHMDVTWDDPTADQGFNHTPNTKYFLKSDSALKNMYTYMGQKDTTHSSWSPTSPACTNTRYDGYGDSSWPTYKGPASSVKPTSFSLSQTRADMRAEDYLKLSITSVSPTSANIGTAVWTSSNEQVALVDNAGNVTTRVPGTATITCKIGSVSRTCTINARGGDISGADFSLKLSPTELTYTGSAQTPAITLEHKTVSGAMGLRQGTDFDAAYKANVNAGTATVTITAKGFYTGTRTATFKIKPAPMSSVTASLSPKSYTYDGAAKTPAISASFNGKTLGTADFSSSIKDNVNAGTATVTLTGKGNFTGTRELTFKINRASVASADVTVPSQTYTGSALKPKLTVKVGGRMLVAGTDYEVSFADNTNAGTASYTVTGIGNYAGTVSGTFTINKASVANAAVTVADQTYDGSAKTPAPTVKVGSRTLKSGTDYSVSYADNVDAGTATVTIKGKGNYTGTTKETFKIAPADLSKAKVTAANQTYNGSARKPAPKVELAGLAPVSGTDYTVSYANNVDAGTATVTIKGKGNYAGKASTTFKINPASLAKADVTAKDQTYSGSALKPAPTVTLGGKTLVAADYTVAYAKNVNAGTATVTVTGKGNYKDSASGTFKINPASIAKAAVAVPDQEWTGKPIAPVPTVTLSGRQLTVGAKGDCKVTSYDNNVDEGTATVTVVGQGNYTGTAKGTFKIEDPAVPVYRLYNKKTSEHLYTLGKNEYDQLPVITEGDWVQEGIAWYAPKKSNTPVYRLYNKKSGDHHYTTSKAEADALVANHGWTLETTAFYSDDAKRVPLYRLYNGRLQRGQHHYTADANERRGLTTRFGWKYETIGFYGVKAK